MGFLGERAIRSAAVSMILAAGYVGSADAPRGDIEQRPVGIFAERSPGVPRFSGEIEETKALLSRWEEQVKIHPEQKIHYMVLAAELAKAFFSNRMGYDLSRFDGKLVFLDAADFYKKHNRCGIKDSSDGFTNVDEEIIYLNRDRLFKSQSVVERVFRLAHHEYNHLSANKVVLKVEEEKFSKGRRVFFRKGLVNYIDGNTGADGMPCRVGDDFIHEEIAVHQRSTHEVGLVGLGPERYGNPFVDQYNGLLTPEEIRRLSYFQQEGDGVNFYNVLFRVDIRLSRK